MQDHEYLSTYANALKIIEGARIMMVCQTNLEFTYVSAGYKKYITDENMIGKRVRDSEHPGKEYAEEFKKISLSVLQNRTNASFFAVYKFPKLKKSICFIYTLNPIINPDTNNIVGLMGEFQALNPYFISKVFSLVSSFAFPQIDTPDIIDLKLTNREKEILFLLTIGYSYKEIAHILSNSSNDKTLTANTVNSIIRRQLFKKFMVTTIPELIIKSGQLKTLKSIPESIIAPREGIYEITFYGDDLLSEITQSTTMTF